MKKFIYTIFIGALVIGLIWLVRFSYRNLRGLGPIVHPAPVDIGIITAPSATTTNHAASSDTQLPLKLPAGFSISIFAKDLGKPRVLGLGLDGHVWVSIPESGKIISLEDPNTDGLAETQRVIVPDLNRPHGFATRCRASGCELYVAETDKISIFSITRQGSGVAVGAKRKLVDLPGGGNHTTRSLLFLPAPQDNILLVSIGSSCNVCREKDNRRATIQQVNIDTGEMKPFANGLRNAVFLALHPTTHEVWVTEMGRDLLGDDTPPDEINLVTEGKNYGWPICYGKNIHDTEFDHNIYARNPCMSPFELPSHIDIPAHSAPLGLSFSSDGKELFVAYHGSWNRSVPTGYKVVRIKLDAQGQHLGAEDFITGWLTADGRALGRPVDILIAPDAAMYISDDKAGVIYRVVPTQSASPQTNLGDESIKVSAPLPQASISNPLTITGQARGTWFFEASFPVRLMDAKGKELGVGSAQAQGDWMTEDFVPFKAVLAFSKPTTPTGTLILEKDNPSGLPANAGEVRIPVRFRSPDAL